MSDLEHSDYEFNIGKQKLVQDKTCLTSAATSLDVATKEINEAENFVPLLHHAATDVVCTGIGKPRKALNILSLFTFCFVQI